MKPTAKAVKAELLASGIAFDRVSVTDTTITIAQIGNHDSLRAITSILEAAGLFAFDGDDKTQEARATKAKDINGVVTETVAVLKH